eukprot:1103446-Ditylum_brightwellii.AAC.1
MVLLLIGIFPSKVNPQMPLPAQNLCSSQRYHQGTIKAFTSDRTTPTHRHHDVKISTVIYHKQ